jgi:hypothetical protein
MSKVKIKIVILGHLPYSIDLDRIKNWRSDLFEIVSSISSFNIVGNSDGANWEFLDKNIEQQLPSRENANVLLAVTNVPLQDNYFARRFSDNRVCITYNEMTEILKLDNIPLENLILRVMYSISFVYRRYGNRIPLITELTNFAHDETRGCIFDMNGIKTDIIHSLNCPQLCHSCVESLTNLKTHKIEKELVDKVQKELKRIKKGLYFQITDFVKRRPILAIILSTIFALIIGIIGSTIGSLIWERFLK